MTYEQFLDELRAVEGRWTIRRVYGMLRLRADKQCYCPLPAVAKAHGRDFSSRDWRQAGEFLGLAGSVALEIAMATDIPRSGTRIATDLLAATGVRQP